MPVNEEADGLRLLTLVSACGAFVAVLRDPSSLTPIVKLRSPRRSPFRGALIRSSDFVTCSPSNRTMMHGNGLQDLNGRGARPRTDWHRPGFARRDLSAKIARPAGRKLKSKPGMGRRCRR
jgi:hypothetical protein